MKSLFTLAIAFLWGISTYAQDIIIKNDKTEFKAKVLEVLIEEIKYKKWEHLDGPTYTILKSEVFMIIYKNGSRETFDVKPTAPVTAPAPVVTPAAQTTSSPAQVATPAVSSPAPVEETLGTPKPAGDRDRYAFTPKDKARERNKKPGKDYNQADQITGFGVFLNTIGKTTVPTIGMNSEVFFAPNVAYYYGIYLSYHQEELMGYKMWALPVALNVGASYYFNQLIKLDKRIATVYATPYLSIQNSFVFIDGEYQDSKTNFGFAVRTGGSYRFSKTWGVFGEVHIGKGDPGFQVGLCRAWVKSEIGKRYK